MLAAIRKDGWRCTRVGGGAHLEGERPLGADPAWGPPFAYSADFVNDGEPFEALQVVIPDARGAWPEDPGYDGTPQPLLDA